MKKLIYKIEGYISVFNPETKEIEQRLSLAEAVIENPTDEQIKMAKEIAYNGEYEIYDDGQPEPEAQTTESQRIADLEEALDMLLSGVTE